MQLTVGLTKIFVSKYNSLKNSTKENMASPTGKSILITDKFRRALDLMRAGENVLLTGKAGTGKSTLLRMYLENEASDKQILVTAPTGVAALNIGGFTIHRTFGFRPGMFPDDLSADGQWWPKSVLKAADVLVIDEISMVRADLFDMMDIALRRSRRNNKPFGGIQLILVGDLLQLPPVITASETEFFETRWSSPYFFSAHCYDSLGLASINLTTVWRQSDTTFLEVLNQVREGSVSDNALNLLNQHVDPSFDAPDDWVTLASRRSTVDKINHQHLEALNAEKFVSVAEFDGTADDKSFSGAETLNYAVGARVMTVINDGAGRFVNGSFGTLVSATDEKLVVRLDHSSKEVELGRHTWDIKTPEVSGGVLSSKTTGSVTQFPVILAWALTVHKSQGKTIPKLFINMTGGMTTDGQFYVALSRAVDLDNLRFSAPIERKHIRANNTLVRMIRREVAPAIQTNRFAFLAFDGVSFGISDHVVRAHAVVVESDQIVADFGTWINPMSDLGDFGKQNKVPAGGLALAPTLGDFWPLLLRQVADSIIIGDRLPMLERAARHQEKGLNLALGMGYDISEIGFEPSGTDVADRARSMATAFISNAFAVLNGQPAPSAAKDVEGSVYAPEWAPAMPMVLDRRRTTDSDNAWAAFSGGSTHDLDRAELEETAEIFSAWGISRGTWTQAARDEISRRANRVGLTAVNLPEVESAELKIPELFRPGARVAFTGRRDLLGGPANDERLEKICNERHLEYKTGVSRTRCDVLVAFDPASMSTKAKKARDYGLPIIAQEEFENWYNNGPFLGAPEPDAERGQVSAKVEPDAQRVEANTKIEPPAPAPAAQSAKRACEEHPDPDENLTWVSPKEFFQADKRVAFRGSTYVDGELYQQGAPLQTLCVRLGLDYKQSVTKTRCDVLVTDSPDAEDGKMKLARRYNKPLMLQSDFQAWASKQLAELQMDEEEYAAHEPEQYPGPDWQPALQWQETPVFQASQPAMPSKPPTMPPQAGFGVADNSSIPPSTPQSMPGHFVQNQVPARPKAPGKSLKRAKQSAIVAVVSFLLIIVFGSINLVALGAISLLVSLISAALIVLFLILALIERIRR